MNPDPEPKRHAGLVPHGVVLELALEIEGEGNGTPHPAEQGEYGITGDVRDLAAMIGSLIQPLTAPLGFNWQINVALIPGMAAREVAVGALGTIYAIGGGESAADKIGQAIAGQWSLATALALLAWYVFAPQCASTLAVIRRETGGWKWMWVTFFYMLGLAYVAALLTNQTARALGAG